MGIRIGELTGTRCRAGMCSNVALRSFSIEDTRGTVDKLCDVRRLVEGWVKSETPHGRKIYSAAIEESAPVTLVSEPG
ncbi:UNVERIFIED_CONTAM: hypothetical protein Sradi_3626500 [Sesamum radiatum]|uniref:Uncharacterized protein n=1 Tax=Sesamum radiatum TaxID=300843 RepID=A0AAW2QHJ0_SESRA